MNIEKFQVRTDLAFEAVDLQGASEVINEEITEDKLVIKRTIIPNMLQMNSVEELAYIML